MLGVSTNSGPTKPPAAAASAAESIRARIRIASVLIPIKEAESSFCDVARIALPVRLRWRNSDNAATRTNAATNVSTLLVRQKDPSKPSYSRGEVCLNGEGAWPEDDGDVLEKKRERERGNNGCHVSPAQIGLIPNR